MTRLDKEPAEPGDIMMYSVSYVEIYIIAKICFFNQGWQVNSSLENTLNCKHLSLSSLLFDNCVRCKLQHFALDDELTHYRKFSVAHK